MIATAAVIVWFDCVWRRGCYRVRFVDRRLGAGRKLKLVLQKVWQSIVTRGGYCEICRLAREVGAGSR